MQGAIAVCYGGGRWWVNFGGADVAVGDRLVAMATVGGLWGGKQG